jgi:hypothetical protein
MAENLTEYMRELEKSEPPPFVVPQVRYGEEADSLLFYFRNDESYARRLDDLVTVFLSLAGDELVGCQVKGLRRKLKSDGNLCIAIQREGKLKLGLFFHLLAFETAKPESRNRLVELGQLTKGMEVDTKELALSTD